MEGSGPTVSSTTVREDVGLERRSIGLPQLVFQTLTGVGPAAAVAVGLLVVIPFAGPALPLFLIVAVLICLAVAMCLGQMARHVPSAGGWYAYAASGLGPELGFVVGWVTLLLIPAGMMLFLLSIAFVMEDVTTNAVRGLGWASSPWWLWILISAAVMFVLAYRGIRLAMTAGVILGSIEVILFGALAVTIIVANASSNTLAVLDPRNAVSTEIDLFFKGLVLAVLVFVGFEGAAPLAEEARDARRAVPLAMVGTLLAIGAFVVVCAYATVLGFGFAAFTDAALASGNPWVELGARYWGPGWLLVFVALLSSLLGLGNAGLNASSRVIYALARNGALPALLARTHATYRTPHVAISLIMAVGVVLSLIAGWQWDLLTGIGVAATAVTLGAMIIYISVCVSTTLYFWRHRRDEFNPFLHLAFPLLAVLVLVAVVYYQYQPLPPFPVLWANMAVVVWLVLGALAMLWLRATRPTALTAAAIPIDIVE
jgi:amino acid transporter